MWFVARWPLDDQNRPDDRIKNFTGSKCQQKQNLLKSEKHLLTKSNKSKLATITQNRSDIFYSIQDDRNNYESRQNSSPKSFYLEDQTLQSKTIGSNIFQSIN